MIASIPGGLGIVSHGIRIIDPRKNVERFLLPAYFHQPARALDRRHDHDSKEERWSDAREEHPLPAHSRRCSRSGHILQPS